jgi:hypothetical protein
VHHTRLARLQRWLSAPSPASPCSLAGLCPASPGLRNCESLCICSCSMHGLLPGLQGFDEYMNLVLDEAEEVSIKRKTRKPLGRIMLKGDNITLMQAVK